MCHLCRCVAPQSQYHCVVIVTDLQYVVMCSGGAAIAPPMSLIESDKTIDNNGKYFYGNKSRLLFCLPVDFVTVKFLACSYTSISQRLPCVLRF